MNMTILEIDQINKMNDVMDYILKHPKVSVYDIRQRFRLEPAEYNMIFDLTMPHIRSGSVENYWKNKYIMLRDQIAERIRQERNKKNKLASDIWKIMEDCKIGKNNKVANDEDVLELEDVV